MSIWNLAYSVTNKCNLSCKHCYASSGVAYDDELDIDEIKRLIVKEAKLIGTKFITLTGGEPFAREDIFYIIDAIKKEDMGICIATNGTLLTTESIYFLKELGVERIQISLEGSTKELNDEVRGKGVFDYVTREVIPELKNKEIFTAISITPTRNNYMNIDDMVTLCKELRVDTLSIRRFVAEGRGKKNSLDATISDNRVLLEHIQCLREKYQGVLNISTGDPLFILANKAKDKYIEEKVLSGCTAGITSLSIDAHGNIKPCTRININLGNVRNNSLNEVWKNDDLLQRLRRRDLFGGKCSNCNYLMICGGCRAAAFGNSQSVLDEDPKCWI